jgi:hypothetical protein
MVMSASSPASDAAIEAVLPSLVVAGAERGLSAAAMCCDGKQARNFLSWLS